MKASKSILIIDDDEINNFIIRKRINSLGSSFATKYLLSGESALTYLNDCVTNQRNLPNVVLVDIQMPGMDGFEFLDEFEKRFNERLDETNLYVLSASANPNDKERAATYKCVKGYFTKPTLPNFNTIIEN